MGGIEVGIISVVLIVALIYLGLYIPVALGLVSFLGVWVIRDNPNIAVALLSESIGDTISELVFASVPLFALMGLIVSKAGLGKDVYEVANFAFYRVRGGLGIATVAANAIFASITGSSIASASVFTRVAVPEMRRFGYKTRFTVGVVAGSSVLGMLIPPSAMLIIYAIVTEQSVGRMFIAGIIPGILLAIAFGTLILFMAYLVPRFVGGQEAAGVAAEDWANQTWLDLVKKIIPVIILVMVVLGGIYGGVFTPTEAGAAGSLAALVIAVAKRAMSWRDLWEVLVETGYITATILFLIISASMYSRMLGVAALPTVFGEWLNGFDLSLGQLMFIYVVLMVLLGTIIETASIILIVVPLFLVVLESFNVDLVWFGIVTVVGAEIGLLTPPLGISCFVIKSAINDPTVSLSDIFAGAFPFAVTMFLVLLILITYPQLSLFLLEIGYAN
ncbi:MAG: TRAP transporter large permease [Rhodospirillaceae bacterium]|jgi:tripartite ATP-independent transporter DctM subunit|nr:TRAP transporter large permease [Rhodospirillaceae bacterium]MBT3931040.1 TRAP transporter large permease [Rhodospirillaceae bacterium]MBT4770797.1 TRAP transporter large permease [Rhodospirillaceae bacterium]MBT5359802.1 TRAP transporter large permease [Rhodospirillaceae bacterium]MBT5769507.1 TRAP transporter large permease [Rhodospirillaceae bacterium]